MRTCAVDCNRIAGIHTIVPYFPFRASEPVFTVSFKVDVPQVAEQRPQWATYRRFMEDLRRRLKYDSRYSHNRPVLPLQSVPPTQLFHIILQTTSHANGITLRIRGDNLYLDGCRMENSEQWLEFGRTNSNDPHLIPGSTFLGFCGGYTDLENKAGKKREEFKTWPEHTHNHS